jgi:hypothetical protein
MQSELLLLLQRGPEAAPKQLFSDDVVFHSPVEDYRSRADVAHILMTIGNVLDDVEPQHELVADRQVVTIITAAHHDQRMNGVLDETYDRLGPIEHATLLLRPLPALLDAISRMRDALERSPLPSTLAARNQVNRSSRS